MLTATILALWALLAPGAERLPTARPIAEAIASASGGDERLAAILALYAFRESSLRPGVTGDGGASCGAWQMKCTLVRGMSLEQQARTWLTWVQASSLASVDSSPSRAARRVALAERLLVAVSSP
jgi:hypothetical protein